MNDWQPQSIRGRAFAALAPYAVIVAGLMAFIALGVHL